MIYSTAKIDIIYKSDTYEYAIVYDKPAKNPQNAAIWSKIKNHYKY